ncbi:MAG: ribosomal protein S18-alanine N-acetyltransferase [Nitrospirae bacterium YQR-1]
MAGKIQTHIRTMVYDDIEAVSAIENISFPYPWTQRSFKHELENDYSINFVVLHDGVIAGYLCAQEILDEAHILKLALLPQFRRNGIGTALFETLLLTLRQHHFSGKIFLEARHSNTPAVDFYKKHGFEVLYARKDYYIKPDEDAIVMMLEIRNQAMI